MSGRGRRVRLWHTVAVSGLAHVGELERLLWPVSAGPGDHWLSMLVTDGSNVDLAIVGGLWVRLVRYKLYRTR